MTAATVRVWVTSTGWLPCAALAAAGTLAVTVAYLTSATAALPLLALTCSAATALSLPERRPAGWSRAARPRRAPSRAPGARRPTLARRGPGVTPLGGGSGWGAHTLPGGGSGSPCGVVRHPADRRPAAAPSPRTAAAGPVAYRVGRAPVPAHENTRRLQPAGGKDT